MGAERSGAVEPCVLGGGSGLTAVADAVQPGGGALGEEQARSWLSQQARRRRSMELSISAKRLGGDRDPVCDQVLQDRQKALRITVAGESGSRGWGHVRLGWRGSVRTKASR
jgi:hypothetical protein